VTSARFRKILSIILFPILIGLTIAAVVVFREEIKLVFSSSESIKETVSRWGAAAPLAFMSLQFIQVVIFIIPGEVPQIAGGYLFGILFGSMYSIAGILIGSTFNFFLARIFGIPFIRTILKEEKIEKFDSIAHSPRARIAFFLLFVIPGIPKDALCYVAGLSSLSFPSFLIISTIGRLPGIIGSAGMGDAAASSRWLLAGIIMGVAILLFVFGMIYRERIHQLVESFAKKKKS
jgi:uncharacterized membrane protein YdjX (TVP38/TMEM64 family)